MRLLILGLFVAVSTSVMASPPPPPVALPDGGSAALMLALSCAGLAAGTRLFRKK